MTVFGTVFGVQSTPGSPGCSMYLICLTSLLDPFGNEQTDTETSPRVRKPRHLGVGTTDTETPVYSQVQ